MISIGCHLVQHYLLVEISWDLREIHQFSEMKSTIMKQKLNLICTDYDMIQTILHISPSPKEIVKQLTDNSA